MPVIKITGNGNISLTLAGTTMRFNNVDDNIIIDCEKLYLYKDHYSLAKSRNDRTNDLEFPFIYPQDQNNKNTISWTGNISSVEIRPNWRTLV